MQSESAQREAAIKHMPTQQDMRTAWSIIAILCGIFLALSLSATVPEVLAKSSHVLDWAAWTVTFSIWLFVALYARRPEYYETMRRRIELGRKHRKSRAERIRAACVFAGAAVGLLGLLFGAPILIGMVLWPDQGWGEYLSREMPILRVVTTVMLAVAIVRPFAIARLFRGDKPVG